MDTNKPLDMYVKLEDGELQVLYAFLDESFDTMSDEEKLFWIEFMEKTDPEFNELSKKWEDEEL